MSEIHDWPPPDGAEWNIQARHQFTGEWHTVGQFHYSDGRGSLWGFFMKEDGECCWAHPGFDAWRWLGPPVPDDDGITIHVWRFHDAPGELRAMSYHGGDEDWVALVPKDYQHWVGWAEQGAFGCCDVQEDSFRDGRDVYIGAHS